MQQEQSTQEQQLTCVFNGILPDNKVGPTLELNGTYPLKHEHTCGCGEKHYDVGLKYNFETITCHKCREMLPGANQWCHSSRFNPVTVTK